MRMWRKNQFTRYSINLCVLGLPLEQIGGSRPCKDSVSATRPSLPEIFLISEVIVIKEASPLIRFIVACMNTNWLELHCYSVIPSLEGKKSMMKLSQRMVNIFYANISFANNQSWTALSESSNDTTRVTTWKNIEPGQPNGQILCAVSTTWLPFTHHQVFDLLTDVQRRSQVFIILYVSMNGGHFLKFIKLVVVTYAFQWCCSWMFFPMVAQ